MKQPPHIPKSLSFQPRHSYHTDGLTTPPLLDGFVPSRSSLPHWTTCTSWTWDVQPLASSHPKGWEHVSCWTAPKAELCAMTSLVSCCWRCAQDPHRAPRFAPGEQEAGASPRFSSSVLLPAVHWNQSWTSSNLPQISKYTITDGSQDQQYPNSQVWVKTNLDAFPPPPN